MPLEAQVSVVARPWPSPPLNEPVLEKIVGQSEYAMSDAADDWLVRATTNMIKRTCAGYLKKVNENVECKPPVIYSHFGIFLVASLGNGSWVRLVLSKQRASDELVRLTIRMIIIKDQPVLSFLYSYQTRDITKNFAPPEGLKEIQDVLGETFKSAHLLTVADEVQVNISKKNKVHLSSRKRKLKDEAEPNETVGSHNREKNRFVDMNRPFLTALGVTDHNHQLIPAMARKWKQVNKFIELFSQALAQSPVPSDQPMQVVDFGSGKGYLTFAVHDYLLNSSRQTLASGGG